MNFHDFWYIAASLNELKRNKPLSRKVLDEWIVLFLDHTGQPVALQDRCLHRNAQLSRGTVRGGKLVCPYHGWTYDGAGQVVAIPAERSEKAVGSRCAKKYETCIQDDYVYIRLHSNPGDTSRPFPIPHYQQDGWMAIRLKNRFQNNVTNCVENFVDIPHTVSVHPGIFRVSKGQRVDATIVRKEGEVHVHYKNEAQNFGWFSKFLNPSGNEIFHRDSFYMPNITSVEYRFGKNRHFFITSQSIPVTDEETLVYTDLTYNYGIWNLLSRPVVRWQGQRIIDQDIEILGNQMKTIRKYGEQFQNSPCDIIHVMIESIRNKIAKGEDPRQLPEKLHQIEFWI